MRNYAITFDSVAMIWTIISVAGIIYLAHTLDTWRVVLICTLSVFRIEGKS